MQIMALAATSILAISCQDKVSEKPADTANEPVVEQTNTSQEKVSFTLGENYFINNTYKHDQIQELKIDNQEDFDVIFGTAARMGEGGLPTSIDFNSHYVLAVIGLPSQSQVRYTAQDLIKANQALEFHYQITQGEQQSFVTHPYLIAIVDNANQEPVSFHKNEN